MTMVRNEEQALRNTDRVSEKQETPQLRAEDVVSRLELENASKLVAAGPNPEQRVALTKPIDGENPIEIFQKNADGTEQTLARGGQADPNVQGMAFNVIHQSVLDGMHHQVAGDNVAAYLYNKTPENIAAVRDAQGQAVMAASMNQGFSDNERGRDPDQAQVRTTQVA